MAKTVTVVFNSVRDIDFDVEIKGEIRHVIINGSGHDLRGVKNAILPEIGAGLTFDVDADLWDAVVKKFGGSPIFKNGLVKAVANKEAVAETKAEVTSQENGDEPINPQKPKRKKK